MIQSFEMMPDLCKFEDTTVGDAIKMKEFQDDINWLIQEGFIVLQDDEEATRVYPIGE